jgi:hypothetical protein
MRVELDLTEDDTSEPPGDGSMAFEPKITNESEDMILELGDVHLRMTYGQFDKLVDLMVAWREI